MNKSNILNKTKLTKTEALLRLAENNETPCEDLLFSDGDGIWKLGALYAVALESPYSFRAKIYGASGYEWYRFCSVYERKIGQVPHGIPELPYPWLAYVGLGRDIPNNRPYNWCLGDSEGWFTRISVANSRIANSPYGSNSGVHYAIDVRTEFAQKEFGPIVEASDYICPDGIKAGDTVRVINNDENFKNGSLGEYGYVCGVSPLSVDLHLPASDCRQTFSRWQLEKVTPEKPIFKAGERVVVKCGKSNCAKIGDVGVVEKPYLNLNDDVHVMLDDCKQCFDYHQLSVVSPDTNETAFNNWWNESTQGTALRAVARQAFLAGKETK